MAPAGSTVTVFVSADQHQRAVPDVVGEDVSAARSKIVNAGLNPVVKTDTTSTAPANMVVRQSPAAGTAVNSGRGRHHLCLSRLALSIPIGSAVLQPSRWHRGAGRDR